MHPKLIVVFTVALPLLACTNQTVDTESYIMDSRDTAKAFMKTLGGALKQQIKADGVASAIPVCKEIAPATAATFSTDNKIVKRVSTQARNTKQGTPDQWELAALQTFESQIKANPKIKQLEHYAVVKDSDELYFRYSKGIRVQAVCLNCHGTKDNIKPDVRASLAKHYPTDVATGYNIGDLRGAISITQKID